jgi:hypothetical protein
MKSLKAQAFHETQFEIWPLHSMLKHPKSENFVTEESFIYSLCEISLSSAEDDIFHDNNPLVIEEFHTL